jgi:phage FluMu protein Com
MPIRFRCAYCNQLLGIARRKAGTVVRCPTCAGRVVVPTVESDEPDQPDDESSPLVFERSDFEEILGPQGKSAAIPQKETVLTPSDVVVAVPSEHPPPGAWGTHAEPPFDVERINPQPASMTSGELLAQPAGVYLSSAKLKLLAAAAVAALALAFGAGLLVGYLARPAHDAEPSPQAVSHHVPMAAPAAVRPAGRGAVARPDPESDSTRVSPVPGR